MRAHCRAFLASVAALAVSGLLACGDDETVAGLPTVESPDDKPFPRPFPTANLEVNVRNLVSGRPVNGVLCALRKRDAKVDYAASGLSGDLAFPLASSLDIQSLVCTGPGPDGPFFGMDGDLIREAIAARDLPLRLWTWEPDFEAYSLSGYVEGMSNPTDNVTVSTTANRQRAFEGTLDGGRYAIEVEPQVSFDLIAVEWAVGKEGRPFFNWLITQHTGLEQPRETLHLDFGQSLEPAAVTGFFLVPPTLIDGEIRVDVFAQTPSLNAWLGGETSAEMSAAAPVASYEVEHVGQDRESVVTEYSVSGSWGSTYARVSGLPIQGPHDPALLTPPRPAVPLVAGLHSPMRWSVDGDQDFDFVVADYYAEIVPDGAQRHIGSFQFSKNANGGTLPQLVTFPKPPFHPGTGATTAYGPAVDPGPLTAHPQPALKAKSGEQYGPAINPGDVTEIEIEIEISKMKTFVVLGAVVDRDGAPGFERAALARPLQIVAE